MSDSAPAPVKVLFKGESEMNGDPIGPMRLVFDDDDNPDTSQPYDPNRSRDEWVTLSHARKVADVAGVPLEER